MSEGLYGIERGGLRVLNVGAGDLRFTFNSDDPVEVERARRTVQDMLQRGYTLLADVPRRGRKKGQLTRVEAFDPRTDEYIIASEALYAGDINGSSEDETGEPSQSKAPGRQSARRSPGRARKTTERVKASNTRTVAVGRSAGG